MSIYVGRRGLYRTTGSGRFFMKYPTKRFPLIARSKLGNLPRRTSGRWMRMGY